MRLSRRQLLFLGAASLVPGVGLYTLFVEPFWLEFTQRTLRINRLPESLKGKTLVQISDLHISNRVSESYLIQSCKAVAAMEPDIVVYTGDFVTLDEGTDRGIANVFPHLPKGKLATYAIFGNHDYGHGWADAAYAERLQKALAEVEIPVLRNEVGNVSGLRIVGLDDWWADEFFPEIAFSKVNPAGATLVLSHNPDTLDQEGWNGYRGWVLSGHTHGGQCKPPFLPAPLLPVQNKRYTSGHIALPDGRDCYISRGLGYLHQVRFNVRPEVTFFRLV